MGKHITKQYYDAAGNLIIKPYRLKDLTIIFDVNSNTFKKWLAKYESELGEKDGMYYSAKQVAIMIEKFGLPQKLPVRMFPSIQNVA